jgi:translation elongation factor P/translation initiation factor 5A
MAPMNVENLRIGDYIRWRGWPVQIVDVHRPRDGRPGARGQTICKVVFEDGVARWITYYNGETVTVLRSAER